MPAARLAILLVLLGAGLLIALQNGSPSLSLVFLGMQTVALPLGTWIAIAIAAGALTVLWMGSLLHLARLSAPGQREPAAPPATSVSDDSDPYSPETYSAASTGNSDPYASSVNPSAQPTPSTFESENAGSANPTDYSANSPEGDTEDIEDELDWEDAPQTQPYETQQQDEEFGEFEEDDEFDWEEDAQTSDRSPEDWREGSYADRAEANQRDRNPYPSDSSSEAADQSSDSVYSYGYREPRASGVGRPEAVYDAEYRVIIPPYNPVEDDLQNYDLTDEADEEFLEDETDRDWRDEGNEDINRSSTS